MGSTKTRTSIWSAQTLTAGAADTTSSAVDLTDGYGAAVGGKITNGGTGPTVGAQVQVQLSNDGTTYYDYGAPFVAGVAASTSYSFYRRILVAAKYARLVAGSNTGQDVTIAADISEVTNLGE